VRIIKHTEIPSTEHEKTDRWTKTDNDISAEQQAISVEQLSQL